MADYKDLPVISLLDACELCAKGAKGHVDKLGSGFEMYASVGFWYNRYYLKDLSEDELAKALETIKVNLANKGPILVFYERKEDNKFFDKSLVKNGFMLLFTQTGMNRELADFNFEADASNIKEISKSDIKEWSEVVAKAFDKPYEDECFYAMMDANDDNAKFYAYVEDGKIIGTTMCYLKDKVAGIHEVGVAESHRGKGIAKNLVVHALNAAKKNGAKSASLQASPSGKPLYESIGFEVINELQNAVVRPAE